MTTHEWETLLDGITPGPWEVLEVKGARVISHPHPDGSGWAVAMILQEDDQDLEEANARVLAAAPAAVAEVVRLRKGTEHRISLWERVAEKLDEKGEEDRAHNTRLMASQLRDILNGVTDGYDR